MCSLKYYRRTINVLFLFGLCAFSVNKSNTKIVSTRATIWGFKIIITAYIAFAVLHLVLTVWFAKKMSIRNIAWIIDKFVNIIFFSGTIIQSLLKRNGQINLINRLLKFDRCINTALSINICNDQWFQFIFRKLIFATFGFVTLNVVFHFYLDGLNPWRNFSFFTFLLINLSLFIAQININSVGNLITVRIMCVLNVGHKLFATGHQTLKVSKIKVIDIKKLMLILNLLCDLNEMKLKISKNYGMQMVFNFGTDIMYITGAFYYISINISHHKYYARYVLSILVHAIPIAIKHILLVQNFEVLQNQVCLTTFKCFKAIKILII